MRIFLESCPYKTYLVKISVIYLGSPESSVLLIEVYKLIWQELNMIETENMKKKQKLFEIWKYIWYWLLIVF